MEFRGPKIAEMKVAKLLSILGAVDTSRSSGTYYRAQIIKVINCFDLPIPSEKFLKYSSNSLFALVLHGIFARLINAQYITNDMAQQMADAIAKLNIQIDSGGYSYRLRTFAPDGIYPNEGFVRNEATYQIIDNKPYMLTKNHIQTEERAVGGGDENSVLTRREVKLMSAYMCANGLIVKFSLVDDFDRSNVIDLNAGYFNDVADEDIFNVVLEYAAIHRKTSRLLQTGYKFTVVGSAEGDVKKFYSKFKISDLLLLRTSFLLIKASSMALTPNYFEDAISNIFISLEGVMTLLQRNAGKSYGHIDKEHQKIIFKDIFGEHSDSIYDFVMDEAFARGEKRASLVHPQAGTSWGWVPFVMGGDYPEYRQILRCMIFFAVTGIKYDPFEYW